MKRKIALLLVLIIMISSFPNTAYSEEVKGNEDYHYLELLSKFPIDEQGAGLDTYPPRGIVMNQSETYALVLSAESLRYKTNPNVESVLRVRKAVYWLLDNIDIDNDKKLGWGIPQAWDAFADGTENPSDLPYTITNAIVFQGLLDALEIQEVLEQSDIEKIKNSLKEITIDMCKESWTEEEDYGYFWYSPSSNDAHFVVNASAMFLGNIQRLLWEHGEIFNDVDKRFIQDRVDKAAMGVTAKIQWRSDLPFWDYIAQPNKLERESDNDLVHHTYILWGMELYRSYGGNIEVPWSLDQALNSLNMFWRNGKLYDFPQDVNYYGEKVTLKDRPAILWGSGMALAFYSKWGTSSEIQNCYDIIRNDYGRFPNMHLWPRPFNNNIFFYSRHASHVLWAMAINNYATEKSYSAQFNVNINGSHIDTDGFTTYLYKSNVMVEPKTISKWLGIKMPIIHTYGESRTDIDIENIEKEINKYYNNEDSRMLITVRSGKVYISLNSVCRALDIELKWDNYNNTIFLTKLPKYIIKAEYKKIVDESVKEYKDNKLSYQQGIAKYTSFGDYLNYGKWKSFRKSTQLEMDEKGIPKVRYGEEFYYNPGTIAQYALSLYGRYINGEKEALPQFLITTNTLISMQDSQGAFRYPYSWKYYLYN